MSDEEVPDAALSRNGRTQQLRRYSTLTCDRIATFDLHRSTVYGRATRT